MRKSIFLSFAVLAVLAITVHAASINKRETKAEERPETPLLQDCEEPGENRENCFIHDPANLENWETFLEEIDAWAKKNPKAAEEFNAKNANVIKQEKDMLAELKKFAALHE